MLKDFLLIFYTYFLLTIWQVIAVPFLFTLFSKKSLEIGWAFGRVMIWLMISLVIWFLAHLGLPVNTKIFVWFLTGILIFISGRFYQKNQRAIKKAIRAQRIYVIIEELIFLAALIFLSLMRGFNPAILDLEKFMDAGFVMAYLKSPTLPAIDMWLAGEKINYYTFGHFMGAIMTNFLGLDLKIAYNLILAIILALLTSESFSLLINLLFPVIKKNTQRFKLIIPALIASYLIAFAGNGHPAWFFIKNHSFKTYWYPDATRFIDRTIHEFPAYSFVVSDLHAHVWGLPIVIFFIFNLIFWLLFLNNNRGNQFKPKTAFFQFSLIIGILLGSMIQTSTWDFMIYTLLLTVVSLVMILIDFQRLFLLIKSALLITLVAMVISCPWWMNFTSISEGVRIAYEHSPIWQLLVLWLPHLMMTAITFIFALQRIKYKTLNHCQIIPILIICLILTSWILIILPEFIYFKDIYPNHPRANTMFKLTFQAIILMNISISWLIGQLFLVSKTKKIQLNKKSFYQTFIHDIFLLTLPAIFIVVIGFYPFFAYRDYYQLKNVFFEVLTQRIHFFNLEFNLPVSFKLLPHLDKYQGLDGLLWLKQKYPNDYAAMMWLNQYVPGRPVIAEAVGESYTDFARVSTFTGLPTILGWRVHEWLWRGGFDIPSQRTEEVRLIYEEPLSLEAQRVLNQYQVKYIFIGEKEREAYPRINEQLVFSLGQLVFHQGQSYIIKLN